MVTTIKVLKRKDASSVVVAVVIALILWQMIPTLVSELSGWVLGLNKGEYVSYNPVASGWVAQYAHPVVFAALQLLLLEIILWLYTALVSAMKK